MPELPKTFNALSKPARLLDDAPALYLYRQVMGEHAQTGVVAACSIDEYDTDSILKHEKRVPIKRMTARAICSRWARKQALFFNLSRACGHQSSCR
jgi:uncharacterized protein (DUF1015 family)